MPRPSKLYIAYGSNLHKAQMRRRAPTARPLGSLMLKDAKLVFRGVADVVYSPGDLVPVGVWRIFREDEERLDRYEGIGGGLYSKEMVELDNGEEALLYVMNSRGIFPPSSHYYETIQQGYRDFGLELGYLENALKHSFMRKHHDDQTIERRERQLASSYQSKLVKMPEYVRKLKMNKQGA